MSNKTEKPTPKKVKDASQKGQTFKCRDLIIACMLVCGIAWLLSFSSFADLIVIYKNIVAGNFQMDLKAYGNAIIIMALKFILPILAICVLMSALPTLLQTGFVLAAKALKLNFNALNPIKGFKKIFSMRTVKDGIKALLYLSCFVVAVVMTWNSKKNLLFSQVYGDVMSIIVIWRDLLLSLVLTCLACIIFVSVLDALADYFLHIKELKMDKQEVKREMKEQEGNPEIKAKRRHMHREILSEQTKSDIRGSQFIVANPTHIALGIYYKPDLIPAPFVSVRECDERALLVREYAKKVGVPVIRDVQLARKLYKKNKLYSFVAKDDLDQILSLMQWLKEVEDAWRTEIGEDKNE